MKMLTAFLLLCAGMTLTDAAAVPEAEPDQMMEEASIQGEELLLNLTVPEAELHEELSGEAHLEEGEGVVFSASCPSGWSRFNHRCFLYNGAAQPWALAEVNCRALGGNLASVHSLAEEHFVKGLILRATNGSPSVWIGGSDSHYEGLWLWSDSSRFAFTYWCRGEPNNYWGNQHCIQMNYGGGKCWDDLSCYDHRPYVCARSL
ncbi:galactose-specific lectin nattectin-like [Halichoeres trimaculatus]|uniref:galactose-specific lectin nattectin-like n=1 Tax=Halichoeres trimaculatus TaxID=147232 RepID=UPI003D9F6479